MPTETPDTLFDATAYEVPPVVTPGMGHDAARTARHRALLTAGVHPATKLSLRAGEDTCGGCAHLVPKQRWWKCGLQLHPDGTGLDIRRSWPACTAWAPHDGDDRG